MKKGERQSEILVKIKDVIYPCTPEAIDALCVITDYTYVVMTAGKLFDDGRLRKIGILVFIDKDVTKLVGISFLYLWIAFKQHISKQQ